MAWDEKNRDEWAKRYLETTFKETVIPLEGTEGAKMSFFRVEPRGDCALADWKVEQPIENGKSMLEAKGQIQVTDFSSEDSSEPQMKLICDNQLPPGATPAFKTLMDKLNGAVKSHGKTEVARILAEETCQAQFDERENPTVAQVFRGVALTPIGSPAPLRPEEKLWHEERPHASSFSFGDPFRTQERPNSAPDRVLVPASPGGVFSDLSSEAEALRLCLSAKPHPPSPEQATFHPQPRRHQPWVMPLLESEASPEALAREGTAMTSLLGEGLKHRPKPLAGSDEHSNGQTPAGTSCGTPALDASTPSPEQNGQSKDNLESPKPHHSVQNTPEPTHQYGCGAAISTPSPCATRDSAIWKSFSFSGPLLEKQ
eukprot:g985.t1